MADKPNSYSSISIAPVGTVERRISVRGLPVRRWAQHFGKALAAGVTLPVAPSSTVFPIVPSLEMDGTPRRVKKTGAIVTKPADDLNALAKAQQDAAIANLDAQWEAAGEEVDPEVYKAYLAMAHAQAAPLIARAKESIEKDEAHRAALKAAEELIAAVPAAAAA